MNSIFFGKLKKILLVLVVLSVCVLFLLIFYKKSINQSVVETPKVEDVVAKQETIGYSVLGRKIEAYTYGNGKTHLLFVGGIHGGYEWNTVLLSYQFMDYLKNNSAFIPLLMTLILFFN